MAETSPPDDPRDAKIAKEKERLAAILGEEAAGKIVIEAAAIIKSGEPVDSDGNKERFRRIEEYVRKGAGTARPAAGSAQEKPGDAEAEAAKPEEAALGINRDTSGGEAGESNPIQKETKDEDDPYRVRVEAPATGGPSLKAEPKGISHFNKGNAHHGKKDYAKAVNEYSVAIRSNPAFSEAYFNRAISYYLLKDFDRSIADYAAAAGLDQENPAVYNNMACAHYRKQDYPAAIKDCDKAIALEPSYLNAFYNRGLSLASAERYEEAVNDFTKVLGMKPDFAEAYHLRGLAYEYSGNTARAKEDYVKALALDPSCKEAQTHLVSAKDKIATNVNELITKTDSRDLTNPSALLVNPAVKLLDVGGLKEIKEKRIDCMLQLLRDDRAVPAARYGLGFGGGILFYGPPGCGKSYLAEAIAGETGVSFMKISIAEILNMYIGNSERNLRRVFEYARQKQPAMIFFDELEALGGSRESMTGHWNMQLVNLFLSEMDGIDKRKDRVLVVGATNSPWFVDNALKRSGRFGETVYIGAPDQEARKEVFRLHAGKITALGKINYAKLAKMTDGCSCADIEHVCKEAAKDVWLDSIRKGKARNVSTRDFVQVIKACASEGRFNSVREWAELMKKHADSPLFREAYPELANKFKEKKKTVEGMFG